MRILLIGTGIILGVIVMFSTGKLDMGLLHLGLSVATFSTFIWSLGLFMFDKEKPNEK